MCFVDINRLMKYRIVTLRSDLDSNALKCICT